MIASRMCVRHDIQNNDVARPDSRHFGFDGILASAFESNKSQAHEQEEQTMCMQLRTFLTTSMFLGVIVLASGAWALNATERQTPFNPAYSPFPLA